MERYEYLSRNVTRSVRVKAACTELAVMRMRATVTLFAYHLLLERCSKRFESFVVSFGV